MVEVISKAGTREAERQEAIGEIAARSMQHRAMQAQYPAYDEMREHFAGLRATVDEEWHKTIDKDEMMVYAGRKQALTDVIEYLDGCLTDLEEISG